MEALTLQMLITAQILQAPSLMLPSSTFSLEVLQPNKYNKTNLFDQT